MRRADMTAAAKFTVRCERCGGKLLGRTITHHTASNVMALHEQSHRDADREAADDTT